MNGHASEKAGGSAESPTLPLPPPREPRPIAVGDRVGNRNGDEVGERPKRARGSLGWLDTPGQAQTATGARGEPPPYLAPLSRDDIGRNDLSLRSLPHNLYDLEKFLPELCGMNPEQVLHLLSEKFNDYPTPANAAVLQHAVNRITSSGPIDEQLRSQINKSLEVLHQISDENPGETDDIFYWAYGDANFSGRSIFGDLVPGWIYWRTPYVGDAMNDKISSLSLSCASREIGGNVILFENANFVGRYRNHGLTVPAGIDGYVEEDVSYLGDAFNDITSSILIVRRFANETSPVSIGALVPSSKITEVVNQQDHVSSAGRPTFTWDMWPTGPTSSADWHPNDPQKRFIYVIVPINVDTQTIFGTYSAQVRYWIYLYVDGTGNLQGYVDHYGCWVEGGWITDRVVDGLMQKIPGTLGQVNDQISQALALANIGGPYRFTYFLPGMNAAAGSTWDDVSVVAVR